MERKIKMSIKNKEGKIIKKDVPENLYSLYKNIGWSEASFSEQKPSKETFSYNKNASKKIDENN